MSLKDSQELFKQIGSYLKTGNKVDSETYHALKMLKNNLRNAQIESLSDDVLKGEFAAARKAWASVKTDYDMIKRSFTPASFENTVKSMFQDRNIYKNAMNRLSPAELLEMSRVSKALKIGSAAKKIGLGLVGGGILGAGAKLGSSLLD